jgi:hypothetical protein
VEDWQESILEEVEQELLKENLGGFETLLFKK